MVCVPRRVSAIIPTFNRREFVLRAISSVVQQTRPVDEILVVDDGSTDGTQDAILTVFPQVRVLEEAHAGVSVARNRGILAASGDWLAFLDSDDLWQPRKIERQVAALEAQPQVRLCHTDEIWVRNGRRVNPGRRHAKSGGRIYRQCLPLCVISPSAAMIRADVFTDIGLFDETLPVCEDYDFWLRLCSRESVVYVDEPLVVKHGGHADQLSRSHWGMDRFRIQALENILASGVLQPEDRDATLTVLRQKFAIYLEGARKRQKHAEVAELERRLCLLDTKIQNESRNMLCTEPQAPSTKPRHPAVT